MMLIVLSLGFAVAERSEYAGCIEHGSRDGDKIRSLVHRPTQHRGIDVEGCFAICVKKTKPLCKAWEWISPDSSLGKEGTCKLYFNAVKAVKPTKFALNTVSGERNCHPLEGHLMQARRLETAATVSTTVPVSSPKSMSSPSPAFPNLLAAWGGDLPEGPLIGISAYKSQDYGALAYHLAIFWMDDPSQLAPGNSYALSNQYWTCGDVGESALQNARDLSVLKVESPVNVEISFSLGPEGGSDNLRHPALNTVLIGRHPSAVFENTPTYMGYVKAPEGLTLATFLATAREQGSAALEMGGYDLLEGKDCQTFTVMMLMKLGLSGLTDVAVGSCINKAGVPWRSRIEPEVPNDVALCSVIGSAGNFAIFHPVLFGWDYNSCNSSCDEPVDSGVHISGGKQYVDIVWCLPNVSKCSNTNCGRPGQPACYDGELKCSEGEQSYGFCVTSSEVPKNLMASGNKFVSGGPLQCPSLG